MLQLLRPARLEPVLRNKRSLHTATKSNPHSPQLEKALAQQQRPIAAKTKKKTHSLFICRFYYHWNKRWPVNLKTSTTSSFPRSRHIEAYLSCSFNWLLQPLKVSFFSWEKYFPINRFEQFWWEKMWELITGTTLSGTNTIANLDCHKFSQFWGFFHWIYFSSYLLNMYYVQDSMLNINHCSPELCYSIFAKISLSHHHQFLLEWAFISAV